ncbi:hypothetical protein SH2C18_38960 [Clostridium sediminicola]
MATGNILNTKIKSRNIPIRNIFKIVPSPNFSPSNTVIITISKPVKIVAVPMLTPTVFENPTWKTSHGAYPICAFSIMTIPNA